VVNIPIVTTNFTNNTRGQYAPRHYNSPYLHPHQYYVPKYLFTAHIEGHGRKFLVDDDDDDDEEENDNYDASVFTNYCSTPFSSTVACCNQAKALITREVFN